MELADWTRELPALRAIAIAAALAALLGWERERARKPAGLRTHILVGAGSALLIILGDTALQRFEEQQGAEMVESDPIRVVQAVIVGISFLGAGTIVHARNGGVEGLTTAASVLMTAAIGMAVALGRAPLAAMITLGALAVIHGLGGSERWLGVRDERNGDDREAEPPAELEVPRRRLKRAPPGSD